MIEFRSNNYDFNHSRRMNFLIPIAVIMGIIIVAGMSFFWFDNIYDNSQTNFYLLPWTLLTGLVIAAPSLWYYRKKQLNLFNPLVFVAWSFFLPSFFIGGLILTSGLSNPIFLFLVQDERTNLPLTFVYIMLGYAGLSLGFFIPYGRKIGESLSRRLPVAQWGSEGILKPGFVLLILGIGNTVLAFTMGVFGFQRVEESGAFDGLVFLFSMFWIQASFLIWLAVFRAKKLTLNYYLVIAAVLITFLTKSVFQGNRGSLIQIFVLLTCSFVLSGKTILFKHKVIGASLLIGALIVGTIYGTTFRSIKQTEEQISGEEYVSNILDTFSKIGDQDLISNLGLGIATFGERIENVSPLAVVVSNYEKLAVYEEGYGIQNNILRDTITFLIPRMFWEDKTVATDSYKYGDLYFNYDKNSFTLTPMGDLIRNFGPIGVPLGMMLLGFIIRIIYASLIENQPFSYWRSTMYFMIMTNLFWEGSYSLIVPFWIKLIFVCSIGFLIVWIVSGLFGNKPRSLRRI